MISCKQASQLLSLSLERKLNWRERISLRLHLCICKYCQRFGKQLLQIRQAFAKQLHVQTQDENIALSQQAKSRIAAKIDLTD